MRPRIMLNQVQSLDGAIVDAAGRSVGMGSRVDRLVMDLLRAEADLVACGAATVRADDPWLHLRTPLARIRRRARRGDAHPQAAVFTRGGPWPDAARCLTVPPEVEPDTLPPLLRVSVGPLASPADAGSSDGASTSGRPRRRVVHVEIGPGSAGLRDFARQLALDGVERVVLEGGARLAEAFFAAGLIDEVFVTLAPKWLGHRPLVHAGEPQALELLEHGRAGNELFTRWRVQRSCSSAQRRADTEEDMQRVDALALAPTWLGDALAQATETETETQTSTHQRK